MQPVITLKNIKITQGENFSLSVEYLTLQPRKIYALTGPNGSGKSTLLQLVAGILTQTRGDCYVHGSVAALLELGAGFNPEFTGRENVYMSGAINGLTRTQIDARFDDILDFADVAEFEEIAFLLIHERLPTRA